MQVLLLNWRYNSLCKIKKNISLGPAHGWVVKFCTLLQLPRVLLVRILGVDMALLVRPRWGSILHATTRRTHNWNTQLCTGGIWGGKAEKNKKEDWQQLLAQVPIFKKKKEKESKDAAGWDDPTEVPVLAVHRLWRRKWNLANLSPQVTPTDLPPPVWHTHSAMWDYQVGRTGKLIQAEGEGKHPGVAFASLGYWNRTHFAVRDENEQNGFCHFSSHPAATPL